MYSKGLERNSFSINTGCMSKCSLSPSESLVREVVIQSFKTSERVRQIILGFPAPKWWPVF